MEKQNEKKYFLGIDAGTDSVGFCVTDRNYNIVKKQGKHLWGARLFDEASTAAERRTHRESRRRLQRRRWRICLLQEIFTPEIEKIDPDFFARLNNSALHHEDKDPNAKDYEMTLFNGKDLNDRTYYKKYPTIYHLRKDLIEKPGEKFDIRLVYLALAHMIKYRGNFLTEGSLNSVGTDPSVIIDTLNEIDSLILSDNPDNPSSLPFNCSEKQAKELLTVFKTVSGKKDLEDKEHEIFNGIKADKVRDALLQTINGSAPALPKIFADLDKEDEVLKNTKIDFTSENFELNVEPQLFDLIGEDKTSIILAARKLYNYRVLVHILQGESSISNAMVNIYKKHESQLKTLKRLIKTYAPEEYYSFFRVLITKEGKLATGNYASYVGYNKATKKIEKTAHAPNTDELYKNIKRILKLDNLKEDTFEWKDPKDYETLLGIKKAISDGDYLPRQNSKSNGVLPYQLNEMEMIQILENQGKYYPFLLEKDTDYTNPDSECYKILSILKFKIPYFVGPLSRKEGTNNTWAVFKSDEKITPWNFNTVIDVEKTEQAFIDNLKNSCTYLMGEDTLPMESLLYSEYILLNEMNNWLINGSPITKEDKKYLIENVYLKYKKVTIKHLKTALKEKYKENVTLSGRKGKGEEDFDKDLHASLKSRIEMANEDGFGKDFYKDEKKVALAEEVIRLSTTLEDRKAMQRRLAKYVKSGELTQKQADYFSKLRYSKWGKLSRKFLDGITSDHINLATGEVKSYTIIDIMREEPLNLMEIYETADKYSFKDQVCELNGENALTPEKVIEEQYLSPAMKRTVRQTIKIIDELKKILGIDSFDGYFIECTRRKEEQKRKDSRKKTLETIYKKAKEDVSDGFLATKQALSTLSTQDDSGLRSKKLYLYYLQMGRSVYTGEPIDLDQLDQYDIDHIIPRALVKDDSINNTVLVEKQINNAKQDTYPIPESCISSKGKEYVERLHRFNEMLMPKIKMDRILRSTAKPLTDDELVGFVNRQLTMTDQSIKSIADTLKILYPDAKIVYSKASNVSEFRKTFDLLKCRDVNDFHHAHDAYLNVVVGNVYNKVYSSHFDKEQLRRRQEYLEQTKNDVEHVFKRDQYIPGTSTCVWKAMKYDDKARTIELDTPNSTLNIVRKNMSYNDPMVTQMLRKQPGFFNKISIHPAREDSATLPLKKDGKFDSEGWQKKYGGYADMTSPYYFLVRSEIKGGKHQYSLETIPAVLIATMSKEEQLTYLAKEMKLVNPEFVLKRELLIRTILKVPNPEGYSKLAITGRSGNSIITINLSELCLPKEYYNYCHSISKILGTNLPAGQKKDLTKYEKLGDNPIVEGKTTITKEENEKLFDYFVNNVFQRPCYKYLPTISTSIEKLKTKTCEFNRLNTISQAQLIENFLKLIGCKPCLVSLADLSLSKFVGIKLINKILPSKTVFIWQSTTGFHEKVLFVVPED